MSTASGTGSAVRISAEHTAWPPPQSAEDMSASMPPMLKLLAIAGASMTLWITISWVIWSAWGGGKLLIG